MPGTLYIVATPIGNLEDITLRALRILKEVDLVAAEDTRVTHNLLSRYGISTPTTPYHQHSSESKSRHLIEMLNGGQDIAVVSDAGTPGVSDPGHELISLAIANDIPLVMVPGPNAIITALVVSGLPTRKFTFEGFPPRKEGERRKSFEQLLDEERTMVFYESPHRLLRTLKDMLEIMGDRDVAVIRELTKKFEEVYRGKLSNAIGRFASRQPRGEITIVLSRTIKNFMTKVDESDIRAALEMLLSEGMSERDAVRRVSSIYPTSRKQVYSLMLKIKSSQRHIQEKHK